MSEFNKELLESHDRRLADHENKISEQTRDYTELKHELRQIFERINMGISPTQNKILEKQNNIETQLMKMEHTMEMNMEKMGTMVHGVVEGIDLKVESFERNSILPLKTNVELLQKTLIYGVVTGLIAFMVSIGGKGIWERVFPKEKPQLPSTILEKYRTK